MSRFWFVVALFLVVALTACAPPAPKGTLEVQGNDFGQSQAEKELIERSAWLLEEMQKSGHLVQDPALARYVDRFGQQFVPSDLPASITFTFKVLQETSPNAVALPNGTVLVSTGLLAVLDNEAQLGFVVGHEITHIIQRDSLREKRERASQMMVAHIMNAILLDTGAGYLGAFKSLSSFNQEQEFFADQQGLERMVAVGFDPQGAVQALALLENATKDLSEKENPYSSHPAFAERIEKINARMAAGEKPAGRTPSEDFSRAQFLAKRANYRLLMARQHYHEASQSVLALLKDHPGDIDVLVDQGDIYRAMIENPHVVQLELGKEQEIPDKGVARWHEMAHAAYNSAMKIDPDLPTALRGKGMLYFAEGDYPSAKQCLATYLAMNAKARDRRFVVNMIKQCENKEEKK